MVEKTGVLEVVSEGGKRGKGRWPEGDLAHRSGFTRWARTATPARSTVIAERRWHGFPMIASTKEKKNTSHCGQVVVEGPKRAAPPPRHDPVCERCAEFCNFVRRPSRKTGRERGSRRLGTIMERLERVADRLEWWLEQRGEAGGGG